ncbi:SPASM domain-containing protein [Thermococcus sp. LS2]|uniref:SPASM domain-containing protein n=1 Tax=Thermococcus sp. LS2 TaxID=1638260 RepID=UPI00143B2996|nr:SPASM domain-containing protein [Thermococcus sp. LS2]NJE11844.1 SPASM domain-containing protein [Thermococcus sp. LS2]
MEKVISVNVPQVGIKGTWNIATIAKPPWSNYSHSGKLERLIFQLGSGKGKFSEVTGIPRSIGCIGNNNFILRREPLSVERVKEIIKEFYFARGREIYLTNYDSVEYLARIARYAAALGIKEVYAIVRLEDVEKISPEEDINFIVELEYSQENLKKLEKLKWVHGALIMLTYDQYKEFIKHPPQFQGEVYLDILYPGSLRHINFNIIEMKRIHTPTANTYHDCLAGTLAITADGYALPCPLLRNYIVGDAKKESIKQLLRKKRLKNFWKLTKDSIEGCSTCPFKYLCHDCRALEYQASGDIFGVEYCNLEL